MPRGNPSPKLSVTVDPEVYEGILAASSEAGESVSAWLTDAARLKLINRSGLAAMREYEAEFGAFTEEEVAEARRRVDEENARPRRVRSA